MTLREDCKYYNTCSAPICPYLTDEQNKNYIWYPDEEICRHKQNIPGWVKQQQKIVKKATTESCSYYFTLDMLKVPFRVTKSVKGLDPDNINEKRQLNAWFKRYRGTKKRKLSAKAIEQKKKVVVLARKAKEEKANDPVEKAA